MLVTYMDKQIVLIVEDDASLSKALQTKFTVEKYTVLVARDGQEGLSIALKDHPSIILLDIMMPVMDGMTMIKHLREDDWGKSVPVIMLTNVSPESNSELNTLITTQPSYYLIKSNTHIDEVASKVRELLGDEKAL
jgi:DNA-binding response OmpR family regulator